MLSVVSAVAGCSILAAVGCNFFSCCRLKRFQLLPTVIVSDAAAD